MISNELKTFNIKTLKATLAFLSGLFCLPLSSVSPRGLQSVDELLVRKCYEHRISRVSKNKWTRSELLEQLFNHSALTNKTKGFSSLPSLVLTEISKPKFWHLELSFLNYKQSLTFHIHSDKINVATSNAWSVIRGSEEPLDFVAFTQFVLSACVEHREQKWHKLLSEGYTLGCKVISKAIRDAPWPKAYSKPLNSKENGGLILHSTKLNTGVLHLASEMSFAYHSAAIFLQQSSFCKWNMTTQHDSCHSNLIYQRHILQCIYEFVHWPINRLAVAVTQTKPYVWEAAGKISTSDNILWAERQKLYSQVWLDRQLGPFSPDRQLALGLGFWAAEVGSC